MKVYSSLSLCLAILGLATTAVDGFLNPSTTSANNNVLSPKLQSSRTHSSSSSRSVASPVSRVSMSTSSSTTSTQLHQVLHTLRGGASKVDIAKQSNNFLRGKLLILIHKICVSPTKYAEIFLEKIIPNTYWPEVVLIALMANSKHISRWAYSMRASKRKMETEEVQTYYKQSKQYKFAKVLHQFGLLQAILYVSDVFLVVLKLLDFEFVVKHRAQQTAGPIIFSLWLAFNASRLKRYWITRGLVTTITTPAAADPDPVDPTLTTADAAANEDESQTMRGYNRFANSVMDVIIWGSAFISVIETLGIDFGFALKSIFGLGSFGTLALSLASKDLAAEFVGGLMIQSSNFFQEGESVVLQDGTKGKVIKVGWLHTYIDREGDEFIVRVPNSQISHQRVARIRRRKISKTGKQSFY